MRKMKLGTNISIRLEFKIQFFYFLFFELQPFLTTSLVNVEFIPSYLSPSTLPLLLSPLFSFSPHPLPLSHKLLIVLEWLVLVISRP